MVPILPSCWILKFHKLKMLWVKSEKLPSCGYGRPEQRLADVANWRFQVIAPTARLE